MKKIKHLILILMILVFLSGLGVLLYPYIRGYLVDRKIERTAEEFLSRVETDPISPYPSESQLDQDTPSDPPGPTEPDTYTDLWRDIVDYNKETGSERAVYRYSRRSFRSSVGASRSFDNLRPASYHWAGKSEGSGRNRKRHPVP